MAGDSPKWRDGEELTVRNFQGYVEAASQGRKFYSTKDGRIGLGPPDTKSGDNICVFHSAAPVFIVRFDSASATSKADLADEDLVKQLEKISLADLNELQINYFQNKPATLIGDAYVYGLMYGEWLSVDMREDGIFIIAWSS